MRKLITVLCLALMANIAFAQETKKGDEFIGHWFIQAQGGAAYTSGETDFGKLISPTASISAGYHFNPVWKLRLNVTGWQAKGAIVYPQYVYKYNYVQGSFDVMVDFCNMAYYKVKRAVNPYMFVGVGAAYAFNNDQANSAMGDMKPETRKNLWQDHMVTPVGRFGLGMDVRIVDAVAFNIEVNGNMYNDKFNSKVGTKLDWQVNALAGFTFKIGVNKGRKAAEEPAPAIAQEPTPAPMAPVQAAKEDPTPKFERTETESAVLKEVKEDIFFLIGKTDIRKSEEQKVADLIQMMKESPVAKVIITGYADANTCNPRINMELSKKRAENVAKALIDGGIEADRVIVEYKGDTVAPYDTPIKNRVAICLVK